MANDNTKQAMLKKQEENGYKLPLLVFLNPEEGEKILIWNVKFLKH